MYYLTLTHEISDFSQREKTLISIFLMVLSYIQLFVLHWKKTQLSIYV